MLDSVLLYLSESALWILGVSGFLSATLLPGASEATFIATLNTNQYSIAYVILVATIGNTLGGLTSYWLGLWTLSRTKKKQYCQKDKYNDKTIVWLYRYGYFALLFSWLPIVGDPLCFAAGWLRMKFLPCVILITLGKALRYSLLTVLFLGLF